MARNATYSQLTMTSNQGYVESSGDIDERDEENKDNRVDENRVDSFIEDRGDEDDDTTCGWLSFRPHCIQSCNRSASFLFFWCAFALFQSTTVNGLVYVITTTIERRFSLTSAASGAVSSSFDLTVLAIIVFVTYLTERLHKPLLIGSGAVIFALGSYVFTLPHFLSSRYKAELFEEGDTCQVNGTASKCDDDDPRSSLSGFYWFFIAGQILHGIGACPLYTHGRTFVYENVPAKQVPIYFAIFQLVSSLGVAMGYLVGGAFLTMYTDFKVDPTSLDIKPNSPIWIGNWWIGFLIFGTLSLLVSMPLVAFPKALRGTQEIRKENERITRPQKGSEFYAKRGLASLLKDFPRAMWNLIRNAPLMFINLGVSSEFFIIACTSVFGPKFIETQFNLPAATAALIAGGIVVPASIIGVLFGGWTIKRFNLKFSGQAKFSIVALLASLTLLIGFLMGCPNVDFAGVTVQYESGNTVPEEDYTLLNITHQCNMNCNCQDAFAPVCGSNDIMYYSSCHAGCSSLEMSNNTQQYTGCSCIQPLSASSQGGTATPGRCGIECNRLIAFTILVLGAVLASSIVFVPSQTMLLGVVSPSQRTTAMGLQSLMFRGLGSVPGPIIFGTIIDNACLIWEYDCDGAKTCWMYRNKQFSVSTFAILLICRLLSLAFFTMALFTYKPSATKNDDRKETITATGA